MSSLLQYIGSENAPISSLSSSIEPSWWKPLCWVSTAGLSDVYRSSYGSRFSIPTLAQAWDRDKVKSQEKAIHQSLILWAQKYHEANPVILGNHIHAKNFGYGISESVDEAKHLSQASAVHEWAKRQLIEKKWTLNNVSLNTQFRFLLSSNKGQLSIYWVPIVFDGKTLFFSLAVFLLKTGECLLGSACGANKNQSIDDAVIECYARFRLVQRVQRAEEQLLDKIDLQRVWLFANDPELGTEIVYSLSVGTGNSWLVEDAALFSEAIPGPWDKDFYIHRTLYTSSKSETLYELPL